MHFARVSCYSPSHIPGGHWFTPCFSGCLRADQTPGGAFTHLRCPQPLTGPSNRVMICDTYLSFCPNSKVWKDSTKLIRMVVLGGEEGGIEGIR